MRRDYLLVRKRVVNHCREKLKVFQQQLVYVYGGGIEYHFEPVVLDKLHATISSYLGHFKLANSYKLEQKLWQEFPFLMRYFQRGIKDEQSTNNKDSKLDRVYVIPKNFRRVKQQYLYFRWHFPKQVILFQVGCYYQFFHKDDHWLATLLKLKRMKHNKSRVLYQFSQKILDDVIAQLCQCGLSVCLIKQNDELWGFIKQRQIVKIVESFK